MVFDMDGTLVKTRAASWEVFRDTAGQFDLPVRTAEEFYRLFEGNFFDSLQQLCADSGTGDAVREHFMTGLKERYQPAFVPGMIDVIKSLAPHYALAVMSSNSMDAIRRILESAGVAQCFAHVFSAEVGKSKREHLRRVQNDPAYGEVRQCSPDYLEGLPAAAPVANRDAEVVLITDTVGDVTEATGCGARAIGVAWGMHSVDALLGAGAERVVYWPQEITAALLPNGCQRSGGCACGTTGACQLQATPVARRPPVPSIVDQAARLGRERHARRTGAVRAAVANSTSSAPSACRCGGGCGISDAVHSCGATGSAGLVSRVGAVGAPDPIRTKSQLAGAISRIARRPP